MPVLFVRGLLILHTSGKEQVWFLVRLCLVGLECRWMPCLAGHLPGFASHQRQLLSHSSFGVKDLLNSIGGFWGTVNV
jgi:hypothetical protein